MKPFPGLDPLGPLPEAVLAREVVLAKVTGDPMASILIGLQQALHEARQPVDDATVEKLARAAAQGASTMARDLVRTEIRHDTLWAGLTLLLTFLVGVVVGVAGLFYILHF